jgi:transcriptional regulator with XRE-family HTH domain
MGVKNAARYLHPDESWAWLQRQMEEMSITTIEQLGELSGINKGTLSKYFHQKQRPSIDALPGLCAALGVSPETLLVALGAWPVSTS